MVGLPSRAEMLHWWGVSEIGLALMAYVFAVVGPSGFLYAFGGMVSGWFKVT